MATTRALRCLARAISLTCALGLALQLHAQQPVNTQQPVNALESKGSLVPTPNFVGKTLDQAKAMATVTPKGGLPLSLFSSISPSAPGDGVVASQYPPANMPVYPGKMILTLTLQPPQPPKTPLWVQIVQGVLTKQAESTVVPPLDGDSCESATAALEARRLTISCSGETNGVVAQQNPPPKSSVPVNSQVTVILRLPLAVVPALRNLTVAAASQTLVSRSLQLGSVTGGRKAAAALPIVSQFPDAGASVPIGTLVDVTLQTPAVPPPPLTVTVPYLEKKSRAQALGILNGVGLQLGNTVEGAAGVVIGQSPVSGTPVPPGSAVEITLSPPPRPVAVPPLGGLTKAQALSALDRVDLQLGRTFGNAAGVVTRQSPAAQMMVAPGASVDIQLAVPPTGGQVASGGNQTTGTVASQGAPGNTTGTELPPPPIPPALVPAAPAAPPPMSWGWIAAVVALEILGVAAAPAILNALLPYPVVTTAAHSNAVEAAITSRVPPAIQFAVSLRDRPVTSSYSSVREPEILQKGRHP
jgi:beta-lactam-binding protein with PASTA domain